jgi:hypothetical protein
MKKLSIFATARIKKTTQKNGTSKYTVQRKYKYDIFGLGWVDSSHTDYKSYDIAVQKLKDDMASDVEKKEFYNYA